MDLKKIFSLICFGVFFCCSINRGYSQNVAINSTGAMPNAAAMLDIDMAGKGLLIPRMTTAQRPSSPITSLIIYNTTLAWFEYWDGTAWVPFLSSSTGWTTAGNTLTGTLPSSPNEWIGTINAADWILKTTSTERLRVDASGNVGIGGILPLNKLHILAAAGLDGIYQSDGTRWMKYMTGTVGNGSYNNITQANDNAIIFSGGAQGSGNLVIAPWGNTGVTSGIRIDNNGNVGVGTATPLSRIQINSDINVGREWGDLLKICQATFDRAELFEVADGGAGTFLIANGYFQTVTQCGGHRYLVGYINLPAGKYQVSIQTRPITTAGFCNGNNYGTNSMTVGVWLVNGGTLVTDPTVVYADGPAVINTSTAISTTNGAIASVPAGTYGIWIVPNQYTGEYNTILLSAKIYKVE